MKIQTPVIASSHPIVSETYAVTLFVLLGCATQQTWSVTLSAAPLPAACIWLEPGQIAVASPHIPAAFSFDKANGKVEYAAHGAGNAARIVLETPTFSHPQLESAAGVVRFALSPLVAAVAGLSTGSKRLAPDQLFQAEADLTNSMSLMADQRHLCHSVLKAAREKTDPRLIANDSTAGAAFNRVSVSAVIETRVEELRLERTGRSDSSFALLVKARARLMRPADGAVLCDHAFEYRSGKALFLDWTLKDAFKSVAETAYRKLAEQMVEQLIPAATDGPALRGAGYKPSPTHAPGSARVLVAHQSPASPRPLVQFVSHSAATPGTIGVYSLATRDHLFLQEPLTKNEAVSEALNDVEWSLDGLHESKNSVVQCTAMVAAVVPSLWKQAVAGVRGLTNKKHQAAEASLSAAAQQVQPHEDLAWQVAQQLTPRTAQPVVLVKGTWPPSDRNQVGVIQSAVRATPVSHPQNANVANGLFGQREDTALVIRVHKTALKGKDGINPPLALCVEAQATLVRVSDGEELYSCPLNYRSAERKFTAWAAHDARLFRREIEQSTRELGGAIVDRLVSCRLVAPDRSASPTLASTSK